MISFILTTILGIFIMNICFNIIQQKIVDKSKILIIIFAAIFFISFIIFNMLEIDIKYNHEEHLKNISLKISAAILGVACGIILLFYVDLPQINAIFSKLNVSNEKGIFISLFIILSFLISIIDYFTK